MMKRRVLALGAVLCAITVLTSGYANAQTPGRVPIFDQPGTGTCDSVGANDCVDSLIAQAPNGNVGIGTVAPVSRLHVVSGPTAVFFGNPSNAVVGECNVAGCAGIVGSVQGGLAAVLGVAVDSGSAVQGIGGSPGTLAGEFFGEVRIWSGGRLGIGANSVSNAITLPNAGCPNGCGLAQAWQTYSSIRYKDNVRPIDHALEKVGRLRGVYYDNKSDQKRGLGVIAEEVGSVLPEIVEYEENGRDARSVDYTRLTAVLIEAVKELKAENDTLRNKIEALEHK